MRTFFVYILFILGSVVSVSQSILSPINHYSKKINADLCVDVTFHKDGYSSYVYDTAFLITGASDTLYPIDNQNLTFKVCDSDLGVLELNVDGSLKGFVDIKPAFRLVSVDDNFSSVRVPCDRSIPISDLNITAIIENDYIECVIEGASLIDTAHISLEDVEISFDDSPYRDQIKVVNNRVIFTPNVSDGRSQDVINYTLKHKKENITSRASITINYVEINNVNVLIKIDGLGAIAEVSGGKVPYLFTWNNSIQTAENIFSDLLEGENFVEVVDAMGCVDTLTFYRYTQIDFSYPEFFSPNGDGVYGYWELPELAKCRQYQVEIFDRSGRLLYRSINNYEPWDGKYEGKNLPRADYWFVVTIHDIDEQIAGHFSLIR